MQQQKMQKKQNKKNNYTSSARNKSGGNFLKPNWGIFMEENRMCHFGAFRSWPPKNGTSSAQILFYGN